MLKLWKTWNLCNWKLFRTFLFSSCQKSSGLYFTAAKFWGFSLANSEQKNVKNCNKIDHFNVVTCLFSCMKEGRLSLFLKSWSKSDFRVFHNFFLEEDLRVLRRGKNYWKKVRSIRTRPVKTCFKFTVNLLWFCWLLWF